jgi:hypothetical protein
MLPSIRCIPARNDASAAAARSSANAGNGSLCRQCTQDHRSSSTYNVILELALSRIDRSAICNAACLAAADFLKICSKKPHHNQYKNWPNRPPRLVTLRFCCRCAWGPTAPLHLCSHVFQHTKTMSCLVPAAEVMFVWAILNETCANTRVENQRPQTLNTKSNHFTPSQASPHIFVQTTSQQLAHVRPVKHIPGNHIDMRRDQ